MIDINWSTLAKHNHMGATPQTIKLDPGMKGKGVRENLPGSSYVSSQLIWPSMPITAGKSGCILRPIPPSSNEMGAQHEEANCDQHSQPKFHFHFLDPPYLLVTLIERL